MTSRHALLLLTLTAGFAACTCPKSLGARVEILPGEPDGTRGASRRILLVADNQLNYLYGSPTWMRAGLVDKVVSVAVRPVQLDLFGRDVLEWILEHYGSDDLVVHLGDATNLACTSEWGEFVRTMGGAQRGWVMAPGNHDAYFLGNCHRCGGVDDKTDWKAACHGAEPLTKDLLVERYLDALAEQGQPWSPKLRELKEASGGSWPSQGELRLPNGGGRASLTAIAWRIAKRAPYRSFVVQEIDLSSQGEEHLRFSAIVLDTAQYATAPGLVPLPLLSPNAGVFGGMLSSQKSVVRRWMKTSSRRRWVLMGHHPYDRLTGSRSFVDELFEDHEVVTYVSAHTHAGRFYVHGDAPASWYELNVGSTLDWPPEWRTLQFLAESQDPRAIVLRTPLFRLSREWHQQVEGAPECDHRWEAKPGDAHDYLDYMKVRSSDPGEMQRVLMDAVLASLAKLIETAPTKEAPRWPACGRRGDPCDGDAALLAAVAEAREAGTPLKVKVAWARRLDTFERERTPQDSMLRRDYRLCQALWASKYDEIRARQPKVDDWFLRLSSQE